LEFQGVGTVNEGYENVENFLKKHWITLLGAVFIFLSFSYLFKYAVDQGWITNELKIGIGLLAGAGFVIAGAGFVIAGAKLLQKSNELVGQIITGLGVALLYATFSFAGIFDQDKVQYSGT
jgi:uncharacterized membrane protein